MTQNTKYYNVEENEPDEINKRFLLIEFEDNRAN